MCPAPIPSNKHLVAIDALRGFAALWVVLYHIWINLFPHGSSQGAPVVWKLDHSWSYCLSFFLFQYGYFGVTIFFVVSGFCIHWPQAMKKHSTGSDGLHLPTFYQRRFWRLYPPYFSSLFVAALAMGCMRLQEQAVQGWPNPLTSSLLLEAFAAQAVLINALFLAPFVHSAQRDLNGVYWTLIFELQFYLLYPFLLFLMRRCGLVLVGMVLLGAELWLLPAVPTGDASKEVGAWWYCCLSRYFEWYLGVVAAELVARRQAYRSWYWIGFAVLALFTVAAIFHPLTWPLKDLASAGATYFLLLAVLQKNTVHSTAHGVRFLAWLGLFSYSLYLIHLPVLRLFHLANYYLAQALGIPTWHAWLIVYSVPFVIGAAWLFFLAFERPFLHQKKRVPNSTGLSPMAAQQVA